MMSEARSSDPLHPTTKTRSVHAKRIASVRAIMFHPEDRGEPERVDEPEQRVPHVEARFGHFLARAEAAVRNSLHAVVEAEGPRHRLEAIVHADAEEGAEREVVRAARRERMAGDV